MSIRGAGLARARFMRPRVYESLKGF